MSTASFPIVCLGASAGGLEACKTLLAELPAQPGMAFVLVQHLDPAHQSQLPVILATATPMPVVEISGEMDVRPDHFYVIPSHAALEIHGGKLQTQPRKREHGPELLIDRFLRSLARDAQSRAVAVILSGSGSDGTLGLCEVKAAGGVTIAQDEGSSGQSGMPHSAAVSGCVDFVLPAGEIAQCLMKLNGHPYLVSTGQDAKTEERDFEEMVKFIRTVTGVDFSQYRDTTIRRRMLRRAMLFGKASLGEYGELLRSDPAEIHALYRDLLINVTSFFRDPGLFDTLKNTVFPSILDAKKPGEPVRIWVPGCSTGQEAYSIAIALLEFLDTRPVRPPIQIFATDLSGDATLGRARAGVYPETIESEVSAARLSRFFTREEASYRIDKSVRDLCIFAQQNITADPPFSQVDLVSCRNVLIYMAPALQQRVLPIFYYALKAPGYLVLGTSESVGNLTENFELVDRVFKVFAKKPGLRVYPHAGGVNLKSGSLPTNFSSSPGLPRAPDFHQEVDRILLSRYAPSGVLINENMDIMEFRGRVGDYLEIPAGEPTTSLLKLAPEGVFLELHSALAEAKARNAPVFRKDVRMRVGGVTRPVGFEISPVTAPGSQHRCFLVMFQETSSPTSGNAAAASPPGLFDRLLSRISGKPAASDSAAGDVARVDGNEAEIERLRQELHVTKEYMQSLVEQRDTINEELRSANEEVLSSNEELQSTNEELETAKEELQSANEELSTINEQINQRNAELTQINNDFSNLLDSTDIPLVVVGGDLRIRLYTPPATKTMNLLPADIGRPIGHIRPAIAFDNLEDLIRQVIETAQPLKDELRDADDHWHSLQIYPYRAASRIDGAVIVLLDIDDLRRGQDLLRQQAAMLKLADQRKNEFLAMLGHELRNPLGPMSNALQILHSPRARPGDSENALGVLGRQLAQLTRIVEDLLDATRIAQGKIELRRERLDVNDVLGAAVEASRSTLEAHGHRFEIQLCSDAAYVDADPLRLTQVLVNLLNNAAKFTPRNGEIALSCRREVQNGRKQAVIGVRDNGIGMAPELLSHVFELFMQGDTFENHRLGGLGIGLSLSRTLTELHGGSIEAHSEGEGLGSEFLVRLPLAVATAEAISDTTEAKPKRQRASAYRILVIEDNVDQAQSLAALLTLWGHEVKTAPEGMAGIAAAEQFKPDIALVDLGLPGISGYQVARLFRASENLRSTRLIAQTGWGQARDRARALEAGFDNHLVKPLDPQELEKLLVPRERDIDTP